MTASTAPLANASPPSLPAPAVRFRWLDLALAAIFTVIAALGTGLPDGLGRAALTLPVILFIPGYLFIQAVTGRDEPPSLFHVAVAVGLSPPLVGGLALLTALVPGGFTAGPIITVVTTACLAMVAIALLRRGRAMADPTPAVTTA